MDMDAALEPLFAAVEENPEDISSYMVLADALLERNDPRGELIQIHHRLAQGEGGKELEDRERALLKEQRGPLIGEELGKLNAVRWRFKLGFFEEVELLPKQTLGSLTRATSLVLRSPASRLLRSLKLSYSTSDHADYPTRSVLRQLGLDKVKPPSSLRRLQVGAAHERNPSYFIYRDYGERTFDDDLSGLLETFERVDSLRLDLGVCFPTWDAILSDALRD